MPSAIPLNKTALTDDAPNGIWVVLLGFYTLTFSVPIAELLIVYLHAHIPVVVIADVILTVGLIMTGKIGAFWSTPLAVPWMAMLALFIIAAVLGDYPGRSVPFILPYGYRFHIFPFYCCAIALSTKNVRHLLSWIGLGLFIVLALCLLYGQVDEGRLGVPNTDFANPNELGLGILFTMIGLLTLKSRFLRILAVLALPISIYEVLQTGSRACLVTLAVLGIIFFMLASSRVKIVLAVLIPVIAGGALAVLPAQTLTRLLLIVSNPTSVQTDNDQVRGALDSQAARTELQTRALQLALRHPLFGVGPAMFEDAVDQMVKGMTGQKSGWQGAHNTYLEIAAEDGIPAMLLHVWCLVVCWKLNYRAYKMCRGSPALKDAATQSLTLILLTGTLAVCTAFNNDAYMPVFCVLTGLTAANYLAQEKERKARLTPIVSAQPTPKVRMQRRPAYSG